MIRLILPITAVLTASAASGQIPVFDPAYERAFWAKNGCGDHSILTDGAARVALERCDPDNAKKSIAVLAGLDPRREAQSSLARRDYRIGATWPDFPPPPGRSPWETPGVTCKNLSRSDLAVFSAQLDTANSVRRVFEAAVWKFLASYNAALVADARFKKELKCSILEDRGDEK